MWQLVWTLPKRTQKQVSFSSSMRGLDGKKMAVTSQPKAVAVIGVCPKCGESAELVLHRKQAKKLRKQFKGRVQCTLRIREKCVRCGEDITYILEKKEVKQMWLGLQATSVPEADIIANRGMENKR